MTVCPVCEHQQQVGLECEVCGKDLSAQAGLTGLPPPPVAVEKLPDLQLTVPDRVGDVAVERFSELEQNAFGKVQIAPELTPDLETSSLPPVGDVQVERVADLSEDRAADDGVRTSAPSGRVVCRYCKNVQQSGTLCERCGMKLPAALRFDVPTGENWVRCRACGAPGPVGERCKECGRVVTEPDT